MNSLTKFIKKDPTIVTGGNNGIINKTSTEGVTMKKIVISLIIVSWVMVLLNSADIAHAQTITLPQPQCDGNVSVEKALKERRSIRTYKPDSLSIGTISQLLWAAQGITEPSRGLRTAPSARASYFIEVYVIAGSITGIAPGMYKYYPREHAIKLVSAGDIKDRLYTAVGQNPIRSAPAALLFTGHSTRSTNPAWMYLEVGHAAQNVFLQSVALHLGTVVMAGFTPENVKKVLNLPGDELPVYIMPVGKP